MSRLILAAILVFGLSGCMGTDAKSNPLPKTEPVTGKVTMDDQPLSGAYVTFIPAGSTQGIECSGLTNSEGVYVPRQMRGEEGVPAGDYKVVISRMLQNGQPIDPDKPPSTEGGVLTESLPPKYSNPGSTTLKAKVDPGGGAIDFPLSSK
jgi:hypothetical protein